MSSESDHSNGWPTAASDSYPPPPSSPMVGRLMINRRKRQAHIELTGGLDSRDQLEGLLEWLSDRSIEDVSIVVRPDFRAGECEEFASSSEAWAASGG